MFSVFEDIWERILSCLCQTHYRIDLLITLTFLAKERERDVVTLEGKGDHTPQKGKMKPAYVSKTM